MLLGVIQFVLCTGYIVMLVEKNCLNTGPKKNLSYSVISFIINQCLLSKLHNFNGVCFFVCLA
jgi:hypothetical protein